MTTEELADRALAACVKRGVVNGETGWPEFFDKVKEELREWELTNEIRPSAKLPPFREEEEELADVILCSLAWYKFMGYRWEAIEAKLVYNENRED